jgi:hypothetical protein
MRNLSVILSVLVGGWLVSGAARADDTNLPRTHLGLFEAQTGRVIIKGTADIGLLSVNAGVVSVQCREARDAAGGSQVLGVIVGLKAGNHPEDNAILDYDELDSVLQGVDYISKANYSVTSLPGFDAVYITRDALRIAAHSSNKSPGTIVFFLQSGSGGQTRLSLTPSQFAQFLSLIQQARTRLDSLYKRG